MTRLASNEIF